MTFGATVYLIKRIALDGFGIIDIDGPFYVTAGIRIITIATYGVLFLPIFMSLTVGSIYGYVCALVYIFVFAGYTQFHAGQCDLITKFSFLQNLPTPLCLTIVMINLLWRLYSLCKNKDFGLGDQESHFTDISLEDLKSSYCGYRVATLLTPKTNHTETKKVKGLKKCFNKIYTSHPDFRYSVRMLSTLMVASMMLYLLGFNLLKYMVIVFFACHFSNTDSNSKYICLNATQLPKAKADFNLVCNYVVLPLLVSVALSLLFGFYSIVKILVDYRTTTFRLYKGELKYGDGERTNAQLVRDSLKYPGYQVAYILLAFLVHCVVFAFISYFVSFFLFTIHVGYTDWLVYLLNQWPVFVAGLSIYYSMRLLVEHVFLQEKGKYMAFDNRRFLSLTTYFFFYYSVFMGVLAAIKRLLKALALGVVMLARMDCSVFSESRAKTDNAHMAFMGFVKVEVSQSHPVMLAFIRLLVLCHRQRWASIAPCVGQREVPNARTTKARWARARWHMAFTLINNPDLRLDRHGYRQAVDRAQISGVIKFPKTDHFVQVETAYQQALQWARKEGVRSSNSGSQPHLVNLGVFQNAIRRRYMSWKHRYGSHSFNKMNTASKRILSKKCSDLIKRSNSMCVVIKAEEIRKEEKEKKDEKRKRQQ